VTFGLAAENVSFIIILNILHLLLVR